jgi:hypothetical protein
MSDCRLIAGKNEAEARQICLNCPLPDSCNPRKAGLGEKPVPIKKPAPRVNRCLRPPAPPELLGRFKPRGISPAGVQASISNDLIWWSPRDIVFNREQCIWLISEVLPLPAGTWPREPLESGYTEINQGKKTSHHAPFEQPCQVTAELLERLGSTKEAGEALVDEIKYGFDRYEELSRPAQRVLNYMSGWRRRRQTYSQWKRNKKRSPGSQYSLDVLQSKSNGQADFTRPHNDLPF